MFSVSVNVGNLEVNVSNSKVMVFHWRIGKTFNFFFSNKRQSKGYTANLKIHPITVL